MWLNRKKTTSLQAAMPRVVPDQKNKFETDELFKKVSQECDVKYTAIKDKSHEERKQRFLLDLKEGHSVITFVSTGTNMTLQFFNRPEESSTDRRNNKNSVDFEKENGKVHLISPFIMNGVCVKWVGWIDLESLNGKARLEFDEEMAKLEDEILQQVVKETQERIRLFDESQRKWQQEQRQSPQQMAVSQ